MSACSRREYSHLLLTELSSWCLPNHKTHQIYTSNDVLSLKMYKKRCSLIPNGTNNSPSAGLEVLDHTVSGIGGGHNVARDGFARDRVTEVWRRHASQYDEVEK